jgi:hypothetical protein
MICQENCQENKKRLNELKRGLKTPYNMGFLLPEMANLPRNCQSRFGCFALNQKANSVNAP